MDFCDNCAVFPHSAHGSSLSLICIMIMECFISQCLLSESLIVLFETEEIWLINWLNIEKKKSYYCPKNLLVVLEKARNCFGR